MNSLESQQTEEDSERKSRRVKQIVAEQRAGRNDPVQHVLEVRNPKYKPAVEYTDGAVEIIIDSNLVLLSFIKRIYCYCLVLANKKP